jgi:tRNA G18 (ribose-2'-O)-methylase SpoU
VPDTPCHRPISGAGAIVWLDDPDDPRLDPYRDLPDSSGRIQREATSHLFVVEGRLAVARLLTSPYRVRSLLVDDHQVAPASDLVEATQALGAPVYVAPRSVVARTVGFALHRGVVAVADRPPPNDTADVLTAVCARPRPAGAVPLVAVLEGLNDHENIGALFRNAAAFGVGAVLLDPTCADPLYRRSIRVSVGHVLHVPFARVTPWPRSLDQVRAGGFLIAALAPHPAADTGKLTAELSELRALTSTRRSPGGVAILLGAEGNGLSAAALAAADVVVSIRMADGVDSLNVATAAAIAFHAIAER